MCISGMSAAGRLVLCRMIAAVTSGEFRLDRYHGSLNHFNNCTKAERKTK
jgi:hypothetical protein